MQRKHLRFGKGFRVAIGNERSQAAEMVLAPGSKEGDAENDHRGSDQWLFVVSGTGSAIVNGHRYTLNPGSIFLIEKGDKHEIRADATELLQTLNIYVPPAYTNDGDTLPAGERGG